MSQRYLAGFIQAGLFNPLAPSTPTYTYELWSWGRNADGCLGLGNTTYSFNSPKQVGALTTWLNIAGGHYFSIATKTDGTLWAWGNNSLGWLGLGDTTNRSSPVQVGALTTWLKATAGANHTLATKTNGTLWSWGQNSYGQLGLGAAGLCSSPVQVGSLTNWLSISAGQYLSIATKTDGTLWAWGRNNFGQLGLGDITNRSSPVQVGALTTWLNIAANGYSCPLAIKTNGTLWGWGNNSQGQLGLNNLTYYSSPKQVGALTTWAGIATGMYHTIATKTDGTLWSWGYNAQGQLGLGNTTYYSSPKQVGSLTTWNSPSAGYQNFSFGVKTNGTLWSWGSNSLGQLGLGDTTARSSPVQVGALTTWANLSAGKNHTIALKY